MASHIKAFPGRLINSGSTVPRAAHLEGGVIGCHQYVNLALWKIFIIYRQVTNSSWPCPACLPTTISLHDPTQPSHFWSPSIMDDNVILLIKDRGRNNVLKKLKVSRRCTVPGPMAWPSTTKSDGTEGFATTSSVDGVVYCRRPC